MPVANEIAVLDGIEMEDGRIGRKPATGMEYAKRIAPGVESRSGVLDPSEGANYGGGSNYPDSRWPLLPSTVGLAGADRDLVNYARSTNVLPPRKGVIDPGGGALYGGGSSYYPGGPLVASNAGLAGYQEDYRAAASGLMEMENMYGSSLEIEDGRIGRKAATGAEYSNRVSQNFETRSGVLDPSEGANYGGGSSFPGGKWPLLTSTVGLAELSIVDTLDAVPDSVFAKKLVASQAKPFLRTIGQNRLTAIKGSAEKIQKAFPYMTSIQKRVAQRKLSSIGSLLSKIRQTRRNVLARRQQVAALGQRVRQVSPEARKRMEEAIRKRGLLYKKAAPMMNKAIPVARKIALAPAQAMNLLPSVF